MNIAGSGKRVRIYLGESDKVEGKHAPLWETILTYLQQHGADGATLFRGVAGFGVHSKIHMARLADVLPDLPVVIEWIDGAERVERLLPHIHDLVHTGAITCEDVDIIKFTHRAPRALPPETVGEVMTRDVESIHPATPLGEAVRMLLARDYRALPVVDGSGVLVGIVTNTDLVERGALRGRLELLGSLDSPAREREIAASNIRAKTVADVMTGNVATLKGADRLEDAARMMVEKGLKRLPVTDASGRLMGMMSRVDLLRTMGEDYMSAEAMPAVEERQAARTVRDLMRSDVPAVKAEAPLGEVLDLVTSTRLNRAVVIDDDRHVLGVVTDADLMARLDPGAATGLLPALMRRGAHAPSENMVARDVMQTPAVTVAADAPVAEAVRVMLQNRRKVLPITDASGVLVGIVDRADLLRRLLPESSG